jgi:hypothetical protein|tara:strand:- start:2468 stop:2728 length:261 start_codon:yes stop_codon:yes gene_type:complete
MSDYKKYKTLEEIRHQQLYDELFEMMVKKAVELDPQQVASTFIALGFRLYRTELDDNDFKQVIETFVKKGKDIKPFTENFDKKRVH